MPTVIMTPENISEVLFEGELEIDALLGKHAVERSAGSGPVVTLGQPICLGKFGLDFRMPKGTEALLRQSDYYLVRLACSFRAPLDGQITFATLTAFLRASVGDRPLMALDIFPKQVVELEEGEINVAVKPHLNLAKVGEVDLGGVETVIKYGRLEPVILGLNVQRSDPGWEFSAHKKHPLSGNKFLYLILEKPRDVEAVRVTLHATARLQTRQGVLQTILRQGSDHLSRVICEI